jgi:methyltransferase-like protein/SAM-dependent methyltransferase
MRENSFRSSPDTVAKAPNPYDLVPYESYPFPRSHIRHLRTMGRLFALTPAALDGCRVLELGGASGGNLIPMAVDHPGSSFLGIDLSARQIEMGRQQIADLGLKNIELRTVSIMDVDSSFGEFDYIIAHGVLSWVPPVVQEKTLAICRERLAPRGIAVVSYNTLPGWSAWQNLRELIRRHCRHIGDPLQSVRQARRLLEALRRAGREDTAPYWQMLRDEIERMLELSDWFLLHDHLEEDNTALYLHQFIDRVRAVGLNYLGEADLTAMNLGALPAGFAEGWDKPGDKVEEMIRRLQFLDMQQNRRFRMSLLCHESETPDHELSADRLWAFYWSTGLRPQTRVEDLAAAERPQAFLDPLGNIRLRTTDPLSAAVFDTLCRQSLARRPDELVAETMRRFSIADEAGLRAALAGPALNLVMSNAIHLHGHPETWVATLSERPMASRLARYQARHSSWLTNQRHEPVGVDPATREVIRLVDGRHSRTALIESVKALAERGKLNLQQEGRPVTDRAAMTRLIPALVDHVLAFTARHALLVA